MKIADILRAIADVVDMEHQAAEPVAAIQVVATDVEPEIVMPEEDSSELEQLARLAGVAKATTAPDEQVFPLSAAFPAGNDVHHSKNPADMRSDSVSLYPKFGAKE